MKKLLFSVLALMLATMLMAVPAKRGVWKTLTLADGREVRAQLVGDEHAHAWRMEDGGLLKKEKGSMHYAPMKRAAFRMNAVKHMKGSQARRAARRQTERFTGSKRGLVILVNFSKTTFQSAHNQALYNDILNKENYTNATYGFKGSVRDYFKAQSQGVFDLQFDVVGPVTLSKPQAYYGGNDEEGNDSCVAVMAAEACKLVDKDVDFSKYDWSGDGEVDQVYIVYAGKGEADSGIEDTVWPHEWTLSEGYETGDGDGPLKLDGVTIDTYACGSEVDAYNKIEGIGTFCHEFSHCLGYPDMYDTDYAGYFGMGDFDLMCGGSYNGNGFVPAGYTAWEKWTAGWLEPTELNDEDLSVDNLKAISDGGGAYIIYNQGHRDEYFLIENRQKTGWDVQLPARGLMVTHVDYDADKFAMNLVNTVYPEKEAYQDAYDYYSQYVDMGYITEAECEAYCQEYVEEYGNDNERMAILHADNDDDRSYWNASRGTYSKTTVTTDLYPYQANDSITNYSRPAFTLYHPNADGGKYLNHGIFGISQNSDGTVSFRYQAVVTPKGGGQTGDYLFYESFDECDGTGGNDGLWSGQVASGSFLPDNEGWESEKAFGANQCAKFGTSSLAGEVTTPEFNLQGEATLSFMVGAWNAKNDKEALTITAEGGSIDPASFTMTKGDWTEFTAKLTGTGTMRLTFTSAAGRFFLDEVKIVKANADGIESIHNGQRAMDNEADAIYDRTGRQMVNGKLPRGLYIKNGKKVMVR